MSVNPRLRIGIFCPIGVRTGGPEALHQLCAELVGLGVDAFLIPINQESVGVVEYSIYSCRIELNSEKILTADYLVVPETFLAPPRELVDAYKGTWVIWWLSVDNAGHHAAWAKEFVTNPLRRSEWGSAASRNRHTLLYLQRLVARSGLFIDRRGIRVGIRLKMSNAIHLVQSAYARDFVEHVIGQKARLVSDYVRRSASRAIDNEPSSAIERSSKPVVLSSPKGWPLASSIAPFFPDFEFRTFDGLTAEEVRTTLKESHAFLDLGHFPGRDRLPREAALEGCPVIIGRRGSGRFVEDFPLPDEFRLDLDRTQDIEQVVQAIRELLHHPRQELVSMQANFQEFVESDKSRFRQEVAAWLEEVSSAKRSS